MNYPGTPPSGGHSPVKDLRDAIASGWGEHLAPRGGPVYYSPTDVDVNVTLMVTGKDGAVTQKGYVITLSKWQVENLYERLSIQPGTEIVFYVDETALRYRQVTRSYCQSCVYDATDTLVQSKLGMKLSFADKEWFRSHPQVTQNGACSGDVPGIVQGLLAPYGIGIDRIWMPKGVALAEPMYIWQGALGVNPASLVHRDVSNSEYAAMLPEDLQQEVSQYRFEFVASPPATQMLICRASLGVTAATQHSSTTAFGHAEYRSPRDNGSTGWEIALSVDRLENIRYNTVLPSFDYEPRVEFSLLDTVVRDGETFRDLLKDKPFSGTISGASKGPVVTGVPRPTVPQEHKAAVTKGGAIMPGTPQVTEAQKAVLARYRSTPGPPGDLDPSGDPGV